MPPRARRGRRVIREVERDLLHHHYRRNGALWDVVGDQRFEQLPADVRQLYQNAGERNAVRRRIRDFIAREQRQGLLDRLNEMRYANPADPLEREAARHTVQQRVFDGVGPMRMEDNVGNIKRQNPGEQVEVEHANANAPPLHLNGNNVVPPPQQFRDALAGEDDEDDENLDGRDPAEQRQIPVLNEQVGRRPYHALARENAEALNVLLTREIPVLTHQVQQTTELMNQLIQRQLDNYN